jgi:hypothetical protein
MFRAVDRAKALYLNLTGGDLILALPVLFRSRNVSPTVPGLPA